MLDEVTPVVDAAAMVVVDVYDAPAACPVAARVVCCVAKACPVVVIAEVEVADA